MQVPLLLEMADQPVVCVGAGPVAAGKVLPLATAGALVTVIAPDVDDRLADVAVEVVQRNYRPGDLARTPRPRLVVAATGRPAVDAAVAAESAEEGIWCLRVDGRGDVAVPGVVRHDGVVVAVATGVPALTRRLRQTVQDVVDARWGVAASVLAELREDPAVRAALAGLTAKERTARWRAAVEAVLSGSPTATARALLAGPGRRADPASERGQLPE